MKIIVLIKQVPGTTNVEVDPVTGVLKRDGIPSKMNPYDLFALEQALELASRYSGQVEVISMGPNQAQAVLREAVYMGADGGVLISDRQFAGADVLATSYALSQGLRAMGEADLYICGKQTTDGDTAQVGPEIAEYLSIPHMTNVLEVQQVESGQITVRANMDFSLQTVRMPLPCLLTIEKDVNTPRLPSLKRQFTLAEADIRVKTFALTDMEDSNPQHYGLDGSPTQVERIFPPEKNEQKELFEGSGAQLADKLAELLKAQKYI